MAIGIWKIASFQGDTLELDISQGMVDGN